jgi:hypothetical protein
MLCGLVWGLGGGFGIVAGELYIFILVILVRDTQFSITAGTLLGEICTYVFFKYCCGARGKRLELSNMAYGTLAHIVREGGLPIAMIVRYSALPAHCTLYLFLSNPDN